MGRSGRIYVRCRVGFQVGFRIAAPYSVGGVGWSVPGSSGSPGRRADVERGGGTTNLTNLTNLGLLGFWVEVGAAVAGLILGGTTENSEYAEVEEVGVGSGVMWRGIEARRI